MAATEREKGSRESQATKSGRDGNWRNQFASTIKERNSRDYVDLSGKTWPRPPAHLPRLTTARPAPAPMATARPGQRRRRACVWHPCVLF